MLSSPGLYIHFPWCVKKCPYCDFNSHPIKGVAPQKEYFAAVAEDLTHQQMTYGSKKYRSVFFGGGTPSLASPRYIEDVLSATNLDESAEVTLELNPGALEFSNLSELRSAGVNRISMGAQSFNDKHLNSLGRIHESREIFSAFESIRDTGFTNINIDLMWGLPHQTVTQAIKDLEQALALEPEHLSWYQLTIEPNTYFHHHPPPQPDHDTLFEIQQQGQALLHQHGFNGYEISAYEKNHQACRHNINYWEFGDYLGIGAGAHGKITHSETGSIFRYWNIKHPKRYLQAQAPYQQSLKTLHPDQLPEEYMMNALRLKRHCSLAAFEERTGLSRQHIESTLQHLHQEQLITRDPDKFSLTELGERFTDNVVMAFLNT
mgnify:CR=1 FL=1